MITVERKRSLPVAGDRVREVLADIDQLHLLMPRVERVEVLARGEARARVALLLRLGRLGAQRIEGEARLLDDGVRFITVQPVEVDARWRVLPREGGCDVLARLVVELPRRWAGMMRLMPQRIVENRIGAELDGALDRLAGLVGEQVRERGSDAAF